MLTVGFDATSLLGRPTGIGRLVGGSLAALAEHGEVDLVAYALSWRGRGALGAVVPPGVRVAGRPMAAAPLLPLWQRVAFPPVEAWTGRLDVVHGTNFVVPPAWGAAEVVTVADLTAVRFPQMCTPASLRYPALVRAALRRGAWVHAISEAVALEVVELLGAPAERVRVVLPGVPGAGAAGDGAPAGDGAGSETAGGPGLSAADTAGPPYILALGTVEPRKDLPGLVAAFAVPAVRHPDVVLRIVGPDGWGADQLDRAIAASPWRDRIVRTGWVADPARLLAGAAVLAYPSRYEGFGFPPLEAMAAGVPVVATAAGAIPEVVGDAGRLVPVGDPEALGGALDEVLSDPALAAGLVAAGQRRLAAFSWEATAAGLTRLYRDAAADG